MSEHDGAMMIDEDDNIEIDTPVIWGEQEIKVILKMVLNDLMISYGVTIFY